MARYPRSSMIRLEEQRPLSVRRTRSPQYSFNTQLLPWQQVPVMVAPVLPGETMKSAMIQARVISQPIVSSLQGWWLEFYLFYVRVGDLDEAVDFRQAIASVGPLATTDAANPAYYHTVAGTPSIASRCHKVVSRAYFRREGTAAMGNTDNWNVPTIGAYPAVQIAGKSWTDSLYRDADLGAPTGSDTWGMQWNAFQQMEQAKLTVNTWEEYLAKSGVRVPPQMRTLDATDSDVRDLRIPELVRFVRDFAYPVPTVDPTSGVIRSTVQWSLAERIDKRRFFAEPGWLFGMFVVRPKVYLANQSQSMADTQAQAGWLPPELDTDPHAALYKIPASNIITGGTVASVWFDGRDPYLYGDQWIYNPGTGSTAATVALPTTDASNARYPSLTDAQSMFVTPATGNVGVDGICSLRIASRLGAADTTT